MKSRAKKRYARHPSCFGDLTLGDICRVARNNGMEVISAAKPGMCVYNEVAVYGTSEQMKATQTEWEQYGNKLKSRSFTAVFGPRLDIPRDAWLDIPAEHRPYCKWDQAGYRCSCDYGTELVLNRRDKEDEEDTGRGECVQLPVPVEKQ